MDTNRKLRFTIEYIDDDGIITKEQKELLVSENEAEVLDELEQVLIKNGKETMRNFLGKQLSSVSKKNSNQK